MRQHASILKGNMLFFLAVILTIAAPAPAAAAQLASKTYFSSAQAVLDPHNLDKSRRQAIQNFMAQGLIQAIASLVGPEKMGPQFDKLQKTVLAAPQKYIDNYQVYSEKQSGEQFQVVGKVTVSMNALKQDLDKLGVLGAQNVPAAPSLPPSATPSPGAAPPPAASAPPASPTQAPPAAAITQPQKTRALASQPASPPSKAQQGLSRGICPTKKEILWAVVEKWDEKWVLPTNSSDSHCIFVHNIASQMDGFGFSILLPQPGSVELDTDGDIPPYQAVSLAEELGVKDVVVGKVSYVVNRQNQEVSLNADLRVLKPGNDQAGIQIRKTLSMDDLTNQAGALELARRIAPQLSALLGGPKALSGNGAGTAAQFPAHLGKLVIHLPSLQYSHWTELNEILHRQFQTMHVDDLQIGPAETSVNLSGVDAASILKMDGERLPSGFALRVDSYSQQAGVMKISFVSPEKLQAEKK